MQSQIGGKGGNASSYRGSSSWTSRYAGGGAGNSGGAGKNTFSGQTSGADWADGNGQNGTGGLLMLYATNLYNSGEITANGMKGGTGRSGGGSSGGGSINIFAKIIKEKGNVTANGGEQNGSTKGGKGGNGTVTINELQPYLNSPRKEINIAKNETSTIDSTKIEYINQNGIQTPILNMGVLSYESLNSDIATVDNAGNIIGVNVGSTKIKITDTANNISTYIYINVYNNSKVDVKEGKDFTIGLKDNGTVWGYGLNNKGQLRNK